MDGAGDMRLLVSALVLLYVEWGGCAMRELGAILTRCFTGSFVCRLKRRVGVVLGMEWIWTGDACCCLFA